MDLVADEMVNRKGNQRERHFNKTQPLCKLIDSSRTGKVPRDQKRENNHAQYFGEKADPIETKVQEECDPDEYTLDLNSADEVEGLLAYNNSKLSKSSNCHSKGLNNQSNDLDRTGKSRNQTTSDNQFREIIEEYHRSEEKEDFDIKYSEFMK